jgi:histidine triad (HIT) family protein
MDLADGGFDPDCVFCRIVRGDFETPFVGQTHRAVAFADLHPQAPVHLLVVPRHHVASIARTDEDDRDLLGEMIGLARDIAKSSGIEESGYRVLTNVGPDAGQSVFHLHLHVLGGAPLGVALVANDTDIPTGATE